MLAPEARAPSVVYSYASVVVWRCIESVALIQGLLSIVAKKVTKFN